MGRFGTMNPKRLPVSARLDPNYNRLWRETAVMPGSAHGTHNGYSNYGCRCFRCCRGEHRHYLDRKARTAAHQGIIYGVKEETE